LGKDLGYKDAELNKWVSVQFKTAEDKSREEQQKEEEKARRAEEREERRLAREEEKLAREDDRKRKEMKTQYELRRKEIELKNARATKQESRATSAHDSDHNDSSEDEDGDRQRRRITNSGPKLPFFDDSKDDIDSYLGRFERYAEMQGWPAADWALYLSALLKRKSLQCYSRLGEVDARDYNKLKAALLRRFDLTADRFRRKFYDTKRDREETAAEFVVRLASYLDRWIHLVGIESTFEDLKALLVRERFLESCDDRLALYLRESASSKLDEVVSLADHYIKARSGKRTGIKDVIGDWKSTAGGLNRAHFNSENIHKETASVVAGLASNRQAGEERVCYKCGKPGHIRRDCRKTVVEARRDSAAGCELLSGSNGRCSDESQHVVADGGNLQLKCGCKLPYAGCLMIGPRTAV